MRFILGAVAAFVLVLVVVGALAADGCTINLNFPLGGASELEPRDAVRALFWPADENGESFRFVVEGPGHWGRDDVPLTIAVPPEPAVVRAHFGKLGGATVLLPREADADLRRQARRLLDAVEAEREGLSTHMVATLVDWQDVTSAAGLRERMQEGTVAARGTGSGNQSWMGALTVLMGSAGGRYLVVPKSGAPGRFLATGDLLDDSSQPLLFLEAPAEATPTQELDSVGLVKCANELIAPVKGAVGCLVFTIVVPIDAAADERAAAERLAAELAHPERPEIAVLSRSTTVPAAAFTDAAALRSQLAALGDEMEVAWGHMVAGGR